MPIQPMCFVVMPFGKRKDPTRPRKLEIDFDMIFDKAIGPGIHDAGLKPKRADKDETGGIIHKQRGGIERVSHVLRAGMHFWLTGLCDALTAKCCWHDSTWPGIGIENRKATRGACNRG